MFVVVLLSVLFSCSLCVLVLLLIVRKETANLVSASLSLLYKQSICTIVSRVEQVEVHVVI
uniref:Uncharacterized protein n=1 Tax=Octopus bimaculoides TaxID=37653 RepID=A0A0L8FUU4_OCTBM